MGVTTNLPEVLGNLEEYQITYAVSTLDPTDQDGATGSITFSTPPQIDNPYFMRNRDFIITDSEMGSIGGRISGIDYSKNGISFTAETTLQRLNSEISITPSYGVFSEQDIMNNVVAFGGFTATGLETTGNDDFPGYQGTLLNYLKYFCIARGKEFYNTPAQPNVLVFRDVRTQVLSGQMDSLSYSINDQTLAKNIEIYWYEYDFVDFIYNIEFTPAYAQEEPQILTVEAGETVEYDITLDAWVASVNQPQVLDYVGPDERTDTGAYCVAGNDGLPVTAAQWTAQGGKLVVSLTDNPSVLHVVVTGPGAKELETTTSGTTTLSPYSIAATAVDDNTFYNSLHITGKGVRFKKHLVRISTGAVSQVTMEEVGATVDNPFVNSLSAAYDVGVRAAKTYAGPTHTVTMGLIPSSPSIENTVGSRFLGENGNYFRVEEITSDYEGITLKGSSDTLISEHDSLWSGYTIADYDANWTGKTFTEQAAAPLWRQG